MDETSVAEITAKYMSSLNGVVYLGGSPFSPFSAAAERSPRLLMDYTQTMALAAGGLSLAYALHRSYNRPLIKDIRGPDNPSWIFGA